MAGTFQQTAYQNNAFQQKILYNDFLNNLQHGKIYTLVLYSKVVDGDVTGIYNGIYNNRLSVINGNTYIGSRVTIQSDIQKVFCTFIYDENEDLIIRRYDQYDSISTVGVNRWYGLCINEGLNFEYSESQNLLSYPKGLLGDTSYSDITIPGASESAEYVFNVTIPDLPTTKSFFTGMQLQISSSGLYNSSIEVTISNSTGTISDTVSTYINRTGKINIGEMADLWGLQSSDLENETLSVRLKLTNTSLNSQTFKYNNLTLVLYYIEDETGERCGLTAKNIHSKNYQLFMYDVEIPEGVKREISTTSFPLSDGELIVSQNIKAKEIKIKFTIFGDSLNDTKEKIRQISGWLSNERNVLGIPVPYPLIFDFDPSMSYEVVLSDSIDSNIIFTSAECEATFLVESGIALTSETKITGPTGKNNGLIKVKPVITVITDGSESITISESVTSDYIKINEKITSNTVLIIDCNHRTIKDSAGTDYTSSVDLNSVWFNLFSNYDFGSNGCLIQSVAYREGY